MARLNENIHEGLVKPVLQKLFAKSIFSSIGFVQTESNLLSSFTGLPYKKILQIKNAILHKFSSSIRYGHDYYGQILAQGAIISTHIKGLDELTSGGLHTGNIYEICGLSASGKTQLCISIAANVSANLKKQSILIIDTKNDVSAHRFKEMNENQPKAVAKAFDNLLLLRVKLCYVKSAYELFGLLQKISNELENNRNENSRYQLIIIDSLTALFYHFLGDLQFEGLCLLNNIANNLNYITAEYHTVILITNLITSWTSEVNFNEVNDEEHYFPFGKQMTRQPALGKYWAHIPHTRMVIQKLSNSSDCLLTILKSSSEPVGKTLKISICKGGIK